MLTYFMVIFIILLLVTVYVINVLTEGLCGNESASLLAKANTIADTCACYVADNDTVGLERTLGQILSGTSVQGIITNSELYVISSTEHSPSVIGNIMMHTIPKSVLDGESFTELSEYENESSNFISAAVPIKNGGKIIGTVYLKHSVSDIDETIEYVKRNLILFSVVISVLVGMLSLGMTYIITAPFNGFIDVARRISEGDFSCRVKEQGYGEFTQLASTLNFMCEQLEQLENDRRNFISDASHELKTPLAAIKLISDSLVDTENPDTEFVKEFLGDLSDEVDRLTRIVNKLLTLTQLENRSSILNMTDFSLVKLVNDVIKKLTPHADEKNIIIYTNTASDSPVTIHADIDKITEVIYNITDNAVKYTDYDGIIKISVFSDNENAFVKIEDTGYGIPSSETDKIFDRFYRPDDSRTRDTGGTGLGLAIAKEAVLMHGGNITVTSAVGIGTEFTVILPINSQTEN